ncbi:MAG: hypothetical protein QMD22_11530, partial [archaeon]|nr:hypothetical protein [archaeon]
KEIIDLNKLFGWKYSEVENPIHPFKLPKRDAITEQDIQDLREWTLVWESARISVEDSVKESIGDSAEKSIEDSFKSVEDSVEKSVWNSIRNSVRVKVSVRNSVWNSVRNSVGAYIGLLFPNIRRWKYVEHEDGVYPFASAVRLWKRGLVPSFDGKTWRLHSGEKGEIVWENRRRKGVRRAKSIISSW